MKRMISVFLLTCILTMSFVSCNNSPSSSLSESTPPPKIEKTDVEKVQEKISAIKDAESAFEAANAYYLLSKEKRETVRNKDDLPYRLKNYVSDTRVRDYYMQWEAEEQFVKFHNYLRNKLLNINSYTVNNEISKVFFDANTNNYYLYIKVDYSAQNKAGGYTRYENNANYFVWENNYWRELLFSFEEDGEADIIEAIYTWQYPEYKNLGFSFSAE